MLLTQHFSLLSITHFSPKTQSPFGCMASDIHISVGLRTISSHRLELQTGKILAQLWVSFVHPLTFAHLSCSMFKM